MDEQSEDVRTLNELSKEEKMDLLRSIYEELDEQPGTVDNFGVQGEVTVRVLDEDDNEKSVETESFKC